MSVISALYLGFLRLKKPVLQKTTKTQGFSIIIPFRNEAENLEALLQSIALVNYHSDQFEVLLINDGSTDNFESILDAFVQQNSNLNIRLLDREMRSNAPKKDALLTGIKHAAFPWIVTTDADCTVPSNWLKYFNQAIDDNDAVMYAAPVKFKGGNGYLFLFQQLHFSGLLGCGIGAFGLGRPFLSNGANLCYNSNHFYKVGGFEQSLNIAGGDDIMLMEKFLASAPGKVKFIFHHEATVETLTANTWGEFFQQQLRWAAKSKHYKNSLSTFISWLVFLQNLGVLVLLGASLFNPIYWTYLLFCFFGKFLVDSLMISKVYNFFNLKRNLINQLLVSLTYPFFIVMVGILSQFLSFGWKERKFNP